MAKGLISDSTLTAIADAIRAKTETTDSILPSEMAALIEGISSGVAIPAWATEIEMAQVTVTSTANTLKIPCAMSAKPTSHILLASNKPSSSYSTTHDGEISCPYTARYAGSTDLDNETWSVVLSVSFSEAEILSCTPGTWTLSNGIATLTAAETRAYYAGYTYIIVMWR